MLTGVNIDEWSLMNANILKFFEKSFGSSELSRIFEMSKGNNHLKIKDMKKFKKSDYVVVVGENQVIRLLGKTEEEARAMYEQAVKDYKDSSVVIYKSFSLYK